jgi:hypothetical protein
MMSDLCGIVTALGKTGQFASILMPALAAREDARPPKDDIETVERICWRASVPASRAGKG